ARAPPEAAAVSASEPAPWYADGLRFRCTACGQCCTGEPGHVWVTKDDIKRMARARGLSAHTFSQRFVRRVGKRFSLKERDNGDCSMLTDGRCTVYAVKPERCSSFPFWEPVLTDRAEWEQTKGRCEGIDQGDLYSLEEIERIKQGDPAPLLKKHARPPETRVTSRFNAEYPPPTEPDWEGAYRALELLYDEVTRDIPRHGFTCSASGNCCDFDAYGHRLYASTLEAAYFLRDAPRVNADPKQCPAWGADRLCKARAGRMLGCRTYFCPPYPGATPEEVHEPYLGRIKALHDRFGIPYAYRDVRAWAAEPAPGPGA
ncbi:MAG: YkgJ family cysteine cluster protein, partial [Planctomycetota bacterium]|nr:YkgJ family cysteine cluster protein [Planctomycetota bacterium]